jgi:hypothetical protein
MHFAIAAAALGASLLGDFQQASAQLTDCPRENVRACRDKFAADGWKLRFTGTATPNMMDSNDVFEVWIRGDAAMLCEARHTRGFRVLRMSCLPLTRMPE